MTRSKRNSKDTKDEDDEDEAWQFSESKRLLVGDLKNGIIPMERNDSIMTIQEAYDSRPEFQATKRHYWARRLNDTRKQLQKCLDRAAVDSDTFYHDSALYETKTTNCRGERRWDGTEAGRLLRQDINDGTFESFGCDKDSFYNYREEYSDYKLSIFKKRVDFELKRIKRLNDPNWKKHKFL